MKSKFADYFNHDEDAKDYDNDVKNENSPIRKGYKDLLKWVGEKANNSNKLIDLGCGTGNTSLEILNVKNILCVDISNKMLEIAKEKLINKSSEIKFIKSDILEFFDIFKEKVNTVISTYAIHHLTEDEKEILIKKVFKILDIKGKFIIGDLMFKNEMEEKDLIKKYPKLKEICEDEFFWNIDNTLKYFTNKNVSIDIKRFSDLSWGICISKLDL